MSPKTVLILILKKVITINIIASIITNIVITNIITNICYIIIIIILYHYYIAYRKLARIIHPDKCQDAKAEEAFKLLSQANNCLSNTDSRRMYDMTGSDTSDGGGGGFPGGFPGGFGGGGFGGGVDMNDLFANIFAQAAAAQQGQRRRGFGGGQPFVFTTSGFPNGMHQGGGVDLDELFRGMGVNVPRQRSSQNTQQHNDNTRNSNSNTDNNPEENPITNLIRSQYVQRFINIVKDVPPIISMPVAIFLGWFIVNHIGSFLYRKIYVMGVIFAFPPLKKYRLLILLGLFILDALSIL